MTSLSMVETLWEIHQIDQLKARYCRLVDTRDWVGVVALFDPSCTFVHPIHQDVVDPRDFFTRVAARITPGTSVHHVHSPEIHLTSATAALGTWGLFDYVESDDGLVGYRGYGFYHHELAKATGEWKITSFRQQRLRMDPLTIGRTGL